MIEFRFKADFIFRAEGIDDAFAKLSEHFKNLKEDRDTDLIELGEAHIEPVAKKPMFSVGSPCDS